MSRIKVLRIIARMNVGGPALQVVNLMRGLDPEAFDHRLLVGLVEEGEEDYLALRAPDVQAVRVDGLGRSIRARSDLRAFRSVLSEVRRFKPDIVHTHTAKAGVLGRVAGRAAGVPHLVHTFHGHLLHGYFSPAVTAAVRAVERTLARSTDRIVAVGDQVRSDLLSARIGRPEQYVVAPPGVALPEAPSRTDARARLGLGAEQPVIAFVARLTAIKRPDRMLDVAQRLRASFPDLVVLVAGEGPALESVRHRAAEFGSTVRLLGWRADVEVLYAAADLVLLTSDNEGMPVSLIEAGMCGCPAVATDVGSTREVVLHEESGFVVPLDAAALAHSAARLLGDAGLRARMGRAAAEHTVRAFGAARLVADMDALYRSLVTRPNPLGSADWGTAS